MKYADFSGYEIPAPTRKAEFPKGIFFMALGDTVPKKDVNDIMEKDRLQDVYDLEVKEIRYGSAENKDDLPEDPWIFKDELVDRHKLGYEFAFYGWVKAGRNAEKNIIEKSVKSYNEWVFD